MKFDDILELIGDFGTYQIFILLMICLTLIPGSMNSLVGVFAIADMSHWCAVEEWEEGVTECYNLLSFNEDEYLECLHRYRESSIPKSSENSETAFAKCEKYDATYPNDWFESYFAGNVTTNITDCDEGWVYDQHQYISTAVSDFNLVCDQNLLSDTARSIYYLGYLPGSLIYSATGDFIGRKYSFLVGAGFNFLTAMATAFSTNYAMFVALRFINGAFDIVMYLTAFIIGTELVGPSKRVFAGVLISVMYAVGVMTLALYAHLIREWRKLQFAVACTLLPCVLLVIILPESARWLIAKKKIKPAMKLISKVAEKNKTLAKLPPNLEELLIEQSEMLSGEESATVVDLLRTPGLRFHTIIIMFNWFVNTFVYYGLAFNAVELGSNAYLTFFFSGLVEIPAYVICIPLIGSVLGRKWSTCILEAVAGIGCTITAFLSEGPVRTTVVMISKSCISATYAIIYIYAAEIFPTVARSAGIGLCSTAAMIGISCGPLILALGEHFNKLPLVIFGVTAILGGLLVVFLPETRGKQLPEYLADYSNKKPSATQPIVLATSVEETVPMVSKHPLTPKHRMDGSISINVDGTSHL